MPDIGEIKSREPQGYQIRGGPCKGICTRYKSRPRYDADQKRCQVCEIFIKWDGFRYPCCNYQLRSKPRNLKYKAKLRAKLESYKMPRRESN